MLTGVCAAAGIVLPGAVWFTLRPGEPKSTAAALLAPLFVVVFISRGRVRRPPSGVGSGVRCGRRVLRRRDPVCRGLPAGSVAPPLIWGSLVLDAFAATGLAAALLVPVTRFTPLVRMVAEWFELAAIVIAPPLAAWWWAVRVGAHAMRRGNRVSRQRWWFC